MFAQIEKKTRIKTRETVGLLLTVYLPGVHTTNWCGQAAEGGVHQDPLEGLDVVMSFVQMDRVAARHPRAVAVEQ